MILTTRYSRDSFVTGESNTGFVVFTPQLRSQPAHSKMREIHMYRRSFLAAAVTALAVALTGCAGSNGNTTNGAADYPVDEIRFIVPYGAGSGPDASARIIATELEKELGASVVVENIEGGRALTGLFDLSRAEPDGSTIGWGAAGAIAINSHLVEGTPFKGIDSVTPIAQAKLVPNVLFASPNRGWNSIEDFIAEAKANPGKLTIGLPEPGSSQAIQFSLMAESAGIDVKTVNYGAGEMILPAANGTVDASVAQIGPVVQYVKAGQLKFIGTLGGKAPAGLEDVKSFDDAGYSTAEYQGWEGLFGPVGMEDSIVTTLSEAMEKAVESSAYQEFSKTTYGLAEFAGHDEFAKKARESYEKGPEIIERLGLKG